MKSRSVVILSILGVTAVAGVGAYFYYQRQIDLLKNHLRYKLISFSIEKPEDLGLDESAINFVLRIFSDSKIEAKVNSLYLEIFVDGRKLGIIENYKFVGSDGIERDYFIIPAKGFSDVPLRLTFSPKLLVGNVMHVVINYISRKDMVINLTGNLHVQSAFISLSVPFAYDTTLKEITTPSVPETV